ncbi:MAG: pitrilysin family protein, partial [Desulfuromonadales bacterium]
MKNVLLRFLPWCGAWLFVLLLGSACTPSLPQHPDQLTYPPLEFHLPQVDQQVLDNGLRLYSKTARELPLVQITALDGAGAITMPREKSGFASLFGATWRTGGAGARSAAELDAFLDQLAANLTTNLGPYTAQLDLSLRADDLAQGIALLADLLRRPGFDGTRLELARLQAQEQVRRQNDNPQAIARRLLMAALYPDHDLGYTPTFASLAAITREDLVAFHQRYFAPNTLWLAVSGDFDQDTLVALLEQSFGDWASRPVPEQPVPSVVRPDAGTIRVVQKALPQTTILIGDLGLTKDDPDQYAVRVFNYILGGGGFNSRMMREIRSDRGLAYSAYSYFQVGRRLPGPFVAGTETKS